MRYIEDPKGQGYGVETINKVRFIKIEEERERKDIYI